MAVDPPTLDAFRRKDPDAVRALYRDYGRLVYAVAHRVLGVDPWCEEAYAVLVGSALARGDRTTARRLLAHCIEALTDLGVTPSDATRQLERRI